MVTCIDVKVHLRLCTFRLVQLRKYSPNSGCRRPSCLLAVFALFLAIISPSSSCTLETSEMSAIFFFITKTSQPHFLVKHKILPNLVISNWSW